MKNNIKNKKYKGGHNVIMSKAPRFKEGSYENGISPRLENVPGPGSYQYSSDFDRHLGPL